MRLAGYKPWKGRHVAKNDTNGSTATADKPAATAAPSFVSRPLSVIPKREGPQKEIDLPTANILLALVYENGAPKMDGEVQTTASDGVTYDDKNAARAAANKAKRLLGHVRPDGFDITTRVYQPENSDKWEWAVWMTPTPAETVAAAAK